jgi:hypothetical protein
MLCIANDFQSYQYWYALYDSLQPDFHDILKGRLTRVIKPTSKVVAQMGIHPS